MSADETEDETAKLIIDETNVTDTADGSKDIPNVTNELNRRN